jgi:hypothetical protein
MRRDAIALLHALRLCQKANRGVAFSPEGLADEELVWKGNRICNYLAEQICDALNADLQHDADRSAYEAYCAERGERP